MTRRYENLDSPVTTSADNPSDRSFMSPLLPVYLNGSTATQKPSSDRDSPEAVRGPAPVEGERVGTPWAAEAENGVEREVVRAKSRNSLLTSRAVCSRYCGSFSRQRRTI